MYITTIMKGIATDYRDALYFKYLFHKELTAIKALNLYGSLNKVVEII